MLSLTVSCVCAGSFLGAQVHTASAAVPTFRSCDIKRNSLIADLTPGSLPDVFSIIFTVKDRSARTLFSEVVPGVGKSSLLRIVDEPLNISDDVQDAASIYCGATDFVGVRPPINTAACRAPAVVDMGTDLVLNAVEFSKGKVAALVTVKQAMLGELYIAKFRHQKLYLRAMPSGQRSTLAVNGLNPTTVIISGAVLADDRILELGINDGAPLVTICL